MTRKVEQAFDLVEEWLPAIDELFFFYYGKNVLLNWASG